MSFSEQLKRARIETGLTQQQVADAMGITNSTYCGYETGKRQPDVEKIKKLASILNTSGDTLLETKFSVKKMSSSKDEDIILKKYRSLDQRGQQAVLDTLNREFSYVSDGADSNPLSHVRMPNMDKVKEKAEEFANMVRKKQTMPTEK